MSLYFLGQRVEALEISGSEAEASELKLVGQEAFWNFKKSRDAGSCHM